MAFLYVPNGMQHGRLDARRRRAPTSSCRRPWSRSQPFKDDLLVLSGLTLDKARANGDGPGDHARAMAAFLTGRQAAQDRTAPTSASASRSISSPPRRSARPRASPRWRSAARAARTPATATPATAAPTRPTSPGAANRRRWPRRSTRAWSSSASSAPPARATPTQARRERYKQSILDFVAEDASDLQAPARRHRPAQARRIPDRRPRDRAAHRPQPQPVGRGRPGEAGPADRHPEATTRSTSG